MIIDDDDELLFLADRFIGGASSGFELIPVSNGQEALQKLEEEEIDAIVCDYDLGPNEMDGLEILEWIREADNQIPFIIFTGQSREEVAIRALNSGADYYLQKSADLKSAFNELSHHIEDVVKHRKLELALEKSEERHRLLVHSLNDLIFVYDKDDYYIQYYAARTEDLFLPPEQFMNRHVSEVMPSYFSQPYLELSNKVRITGEKKEFEYYLDIMGERRWFITNLELHDDGESIIGVVRTITEKKFTEHALEIAQFSIDSNTDPIMWVGPNAEIVYVNDATCQIVGFTQNEILSMKMVDIDPTFDDKRWPAFWNELKDKKSLVFEYVLKAKSGKTHPVEISVNYAEFEGKEYAFAYGRDISKRKQTEVELQKLTRAVEFSPTCVIITDLDGNIEYVNPKFAELTGYSFEEVLGKNPSILQSGLTPPETYPELWDTIKAGKEWRGVFVNKKKNGEIYWEEAWLAPIKGINDRITHIVAIKEDITVRRMMEEELENSEARWRSLVDETPMMILTINQNSEVTFANQTVLSLIPDILGSSVENYINYIVEEDRESASDAIKEVLATQKPTGFKISLNIPEKGHSWYDVRVAPIKLQGDTLSVIAILADITDLATAQRVLRESEIKFRSLYMDAPLAYHSLNEEGKLIEVNNTWLKTLGYKRGDVIGKSFGAFLTPKSKELFLTRFSTFKEKGVIYSVQFDVNRVDGRIIQIAVDGVIALDDFGRFKQTHCIFQDISERVRTQQMLKENEQLLVKQKLELSDFVHSMSHDIGNSLSVVKGLVELISKEYNPDIISRITQTVQMMQDLLNSSVILADAGQVIGDKQVVSLGQILDQVARAIIPKDIKYKRDELPLVSGDRQKISQIFQNILANAVIHGNPAVIEIKYEDSETGPTLLITNDGKQIPPEVQSRLFKGDIRSRKRGEGLGLLIVRRLIDAHGWEIDYVSDPQPTFQIHLDQIVE